MKYIHKKGRHGNDANQEGSSQETRAIRPGERSKIYSKISSGKQNDTKDGSMEGNYILAYYSSS